MRFSIEERTFVVRSYYSGGITEVKDTWNNEFATGPPSRQQIYNIISKFERTGSIADAPRSGRPTTSTTLENQERVAQLLVENPKTSSRRGCLELDISHTSYRRIVKKLKFKCYMPRLTHGLIEDDPDRRLQYCELMLNEYSNDETLFDQIIFSDEVQFKLNGLVNRHNSVYYDTINPHILYETQLNQPGVQVWGGFSSFGIFGPYFFDGNVTGASYLNLLQDNLIPGLKAVYPEEMETFYFQQDGAPAHYSVGVRDYLDGEFVTGVIGRRGAIEWPPRSPDLTPLDFFLWGYVKDKVYARKPRTMEQLRLYIEDAFLDIEINATMRRNVINSIPGRLQDCIDVEGHTFEYLK